MVEVSIILPCRNEEKALQFCLDEIKATIKKNNIDAEIIVSDSSIDNSPEIARKNKVTLVKHDKEGYGNAYIEGFKAAKGKYIFMADADGSYDFKQLPEFLHYLRNGYDFVIGNRFSGKMENGVMPWHHKYVGNPMLSSLLRLFFITKVRDVHCGIRAIRKESLQKLNLRTSGMEFASEMVMKVVKNKMKIKEIGVPYRNRMGKSKLRSFSDGWRHLRFMLLYSPLFLFFIPGIISFLFGLLGLIAFSFFNPVILGRQFFVHPMFVMAMFVMLGYQLIVFAAFSKTYAINHLGDKSRLMNRLFRVLSIEKVSIVGILFVIAGLELFLHIVYVWINNNFGALDQIKSGILALTLFVLGIQTIFSSFMLSILGIKER